MKAYEQILRWCVKQEKPPIGMRLFSDKCWVVKLGLGPFFVSKDVLNENVVVACGDTWEEVREKLLPQIIKSDRRRTPVEKRTQT